MPSFDIDRPLCWAHRGFSARNPENTLASFQAALDAGAEGIELDELDVTLSRDGRMIVIHDETLDRTTDGSGPVSGLSLDELRALDAGSWYGPEFAGQRLPLLTEVLDLVGGKMLVNIEIKPEAAWVRTGEPVEKQVLDVVRERGLMDSVLVSSFDYGVLIRLRGLDEDIRLGALFTGQEENVDFRALIAAIDAFSLHFRAAELSQDVAELFHDDGVRLYCWTEAWDDESEAVAHCLAVGADGVFANDVAAFIAARG